MGKSEGKVEKLFDELVQTELNGFTRKCVFPGHRGAPDRIAFIPNAGAIFAEIKTESGELSKLQVRELRRIMSVGCYAVVLSGKGEVRRFIEDIKRQLQPEPWLVDQDKEKTNDA